MSSATGTTGLNLGFLAVLAEASGYLGGYLVTNGWGRPLEFRISSAVQPNRLQQILYGESLRPYICADLIGKTLVDKTATGVQIIVTDCEAVLEMRRSVETLVVWLAPSGSRLPRYFAGPGATEQEFDASQSFGSDLINPAGPALSSAAGNIFCHPHFVADKPVVRKLLDRLHGTLDLAEPFRRIREAIGEARKMGAATRG